MDNKAIRLLNLRKLLKETKTATSLAFAANTSPAYLSQILSNRTKGKIGDKLARKLEAALDKPVGWLDLVHEDHDNAQKQASSHIPAPLLTIDNIQALNIPEKIFCLKMEGSAMISSLHIAQSICPGDLLIIHTDIQAELGDMVLVRIKDSLKIRLLNKDGNELILQPLNPQYAISRRDPETQILGVITEVRRPLRGF